MTDYPDPYYADPSTVLYHGDALEVAARLPDRHVDCIVTSPPYYGQRNYGDDRQYGLESTPAEYVERLRALFAELHRVLADDGTLWLNLGDTYAAVRPHRRDGLPKKCLIGIPWRVAFALQEDGWYIRNDVIWHKTNSQPESVSDRLTRRYENIFLLTKSRYYHFDLDPIRQAPVREYKRASRLGERQGSYIDAGGLRTRHEGHNGAHERGVNPGDVWPLATASFRDAHFATFPLEIPRRAILAGCKHGGVVLDPFSGAGTTGRAANLEGRRYIGIDINSEYLDLSLKVAR